MAPDLDARGIVVRFGGLTAVDRVDLDLRGPILLGIIGPNGAGKTTFFNALSGVVIPDAGELLVGGIDLMGKPAHVFARAGIALLYQDYSHPVYPQQGAGEFVPGLSVIDALMNCGIEGTGKLLEGKR